MHIFSFLSIEDRINAESVCEQWYSASQELWKSSKRLDVDRSKWHSGNLEEFKRVEIAIFKTVLERCGPYLTEIDLTHLCTKNKQDRYIHNHYDYDLYMKKDKSLQSFEGIKALASNCTNIEKLSLCCSVVNCDDQHLLDIFRMNKKIRFLNLMGYQIYGTCLYGLSAHVIETLLMQHCFVLSKHLCMLLERCVNLNILSLNHTSPYNAGNCGDVLRCISLTNIKNLKELYLGNVCDDLQEDAMYTSFRVNENFKNLIAIKINNVLSEFMDDLMIAIGRNCKNLERADFNGCVYVTDDILMNITTLPKLEVLCIDELEFITDRSLICLSKHLKILKCAGSQISDTGVLALLKKSENIEILELSFCKNITNQSVDYAVDVTKHRTNDVILNMYVDPTYVGKWEIKEESPFFRLHYALTAKEELERMCIQCGWYLTYSSTRCSKNFLQKDSFFKIDSSMPERQTTTRSSHRCLCQGILNDPNID